MMIGPIVSLISGTTVAAANGANDNGKGVATLIGARVLEERRALWLGHLATLVGAIASLVVSRGLIRVFQGSGLLPAELVGDPAVLCVVGAAAAGTLWLATWLRIPISTTHSLAGALIGVSLAVSGTVAAGPLLNKLVVPLLASPVLSAVMAGVAYSGLHRLRLRLGVNKETCVCMTVEKRPQWVPVSSLATGGTAQLPSGYSGSTLAVRTASMAECQERHAGAVLGFSAARVLDNVHLASAAGVSLARGLNDAPKLAALLIGLTAWWTAQWAVGLVAIAMFLGGWIGAKRVTGTMSHRITKMNAGSSTAANLTATTLVILASFIALPVSTTHVTCGALFGIGAAQGQAQWKSIGGILLAWVATVPLAAALAAGMLGVFVSL